MCNGKTPEFGNKSIWVRILFYAYWSGELGQIIGILRSLTVIVGGFCEIKSDHVWKMEHNARIMVLAPLVLWGTSLGFSLCEYPSLTRYFILECNMVGILKHVLWSPFMKR